MSDIHIVFSRFSVFYSPLIATFAKGFLQEEGFTPSHAPLAAGENAAEMLLAGTVTVAQSAVSQGFMALERGAPTAIRHFAQINERDGFFLVGRVPEPDFAWPRLAGRRLLVDHGAQPLAMLKYACHKAGLDFAAIAAIDSGTPAEMDAAFRAGEGDYVHLQGPLPQRLEADGVGHVVAAAGAASGITAFSSLAAAPEWLASDAAGAFLRAYRKARAFVIEAPVDEVGAAIAPYFPEVAPAVVAGTIAAYRRLGNWTPHLEITESAYEGSLDVFLHAGLISRRHRFDQVVVPPPG